MARLTCVSPLHGIVWLHPACRAQEFKALQQHIDDLTEEKFMLQVGDVRL